MNEEFYKNKTFDLLISEIKECRKDFTGGLESVRKEISEIKDNHLVHLDQRIDKVEQKIAYYLGATAVIIFSVQFIIDKYIK